VVLATPESLVEVHEMAEGSSGVLAQPALSELMTALPREQPSGERLRRPYKVKQVADALGVSPAAIYREIEIGRLGAYRIGKGALRVPHEAFERYKAVITAAAAAKRPRGAA
jgi:excisionase family DNA binding protein